MRFDRRYRVVNRKQSRRDDVKIVILVASSREFLTYVLYFQIFLTIMIIKMPSHERARGQLSMEVALLRTRWRTCTLFVPVESCARVSVRVGFVGCRVRTYRILSKT